MHNSEEEIKKIILNALKEDIGSGDITTECTVDPDLILNGKIIAKEAGVIAGVDLAKLTLSLLDENVEFEHFVENGESVESGSEIIKVKGAGRALLSSERLILNLMQRMSGIATITRKFVEQVRGTNAKILDTRKTAPGLRHFDKWAVRIGGGENHRIGLFDMILIKDNHITAAGGITESIKKVKIGNKNNLLIEVEVKNTKELKEVLSFGADRILLDNMTISEMREAVNINNGQISLEASGNVNIENVKNIAETGVDYISIGMLTHSVKALDLSFLIS